MILIWDIHAGCYRLLWIKHIWELKESNQTQISQCHNLRSWCFRTNDMSRTSWTEGTSPIRTSGRVVTIKQLLKYPHKHLTSDMWQTNTCLTNSTNLTNTNLNEVYKKGRIHQSWSSVNSVLVHQACSISQLLCTLLFWVSGNHFGLELVFIQLD